MPTPPGGNATRPAVILVCLFILVIVIGHTFDNTPSRNDDVGEISPHAYMPPTADEIREARGKPVEAALPPEEEIEGL